MAQWKHMESRKNIFKDLHKVHIPTSVGFVLVANLAWNLAAETEQILAAGSVQTYLALLSVLDPENCETVALA